MADCRSGTWQPPGSCMNWEQPSCPGMAPHSSSLISLKGAGAYPEPCLVSGLAPCPSILSGLWETWPRGLKGLTGRVERE